MKRNYKSEYELALLAQSLCLAVVVRERLGEALLSPAMRRKNYTVSQLRRHIEACKAKLGDYVIVPPAESDADFFVAWRI
jgi:hypothetical protein